MGPAFWFPMVASQLRALSEACAAHGHVFANEPHAGHFYTPSFYRTHRYYHVLCKGFPGDSPYEFLYGGGVQLPDNNLEDEQTLASLYRINEAEALGLNDGNVVEYVNRELGFYNRRIGARIILEGLFDTWGFRLVEDLRSQFEPFALPPRILGATDGGAFEVEARFVDVETLELCSESVIVAGDGRFLSEPGFNKRVLCGAVEEHDVFD